MLNDSVILFAPSSELELDAPEGSLLTACSSKKPSIVTSLTVKCKELFLLAYFSSRLFYS